MRWVLLLATASSCGRPDALGDTPVIGGTPEVRAAVRAELAAFDRATGGGRARVSRVRIRELDGIAQLERVTNAIALSDALAPHAAAVALRHELCHALDDRERLSVDALYGRLADGLAESVPGFSGGRHGEREAFAGYCSLGPDAAQLLAGACPAEPPDVARIGADLWERVWVAAPWLPVAVEGPAWAWVDGGSAPREVRALGAGYGAVHLVWQDGDAHREGVFDLRGGVPQGLPPDVQAAEALPEGLPGAPLRVAGVGWAAGPAAAVVTAHLYHLGEAERLLVSDGAGWAVLEDGCVDGPPFAADGVVFTLRVDRTRISWGPAP
jgi:hypothetical protein